MSLKADIAALQHGVDNTDPASTWFPADTALVKRIVAELTAREVDQTTPKPGVKADAAEVARLAVLVDKQRREIQGLRDQLNLASAERDSLRIAAKDFHKKADGG